MIDVHCGWDPQRRLIKRGGCGVWLGYETAKSWGYFPRTPHFHNGIAYCHKCIKGFQVRHLGQGVFVRPKEEGDNQPVPAGPGLEELY